MANKFTRWAPNEYVGLPIDYYQSALMLKEQRTGESLDKINGIINAYGSIQAISPDAEALYTQTIDNLKTSVEGLAKEALDTPQAQRRVNKLLNDPNTVDALDKVYTDALLGAEARKQMNEYLKDNPAVNTVDYMLAFNNLGAEKGDPTKFNPNRFKNMPALTKYFDINKTVAEEVSKLKANEQEVKRIMGNKYVTYKEAGVLEDRIHDLAVGRVMADPQAKAQFERNVRYTNYLANPYDIGAGAKMNAQKYRQGIAASKEQIRQNLTTAFAGKDQKAIESDKKLQQSAIMADRMMRNYDQLEKLDDDQLNQQMAMEAFTSSFAPYANKQTKYEEEFTPEYLQRLRDQSAWARMSFRLKAQKKMIDDALTVNPLTSPDQRQQQEITPDSWNGYIKDKVPELRGIKLDRNGALLPGNYEDRYEKWDGKWYDKDDRVTLRSGEPIPEGFKEVKRTNVPGYGGGGGGIYIDYLRKDAEGSDKKPDGTKQYEKAKEQLRGYLKNISISPNLGIYGNLDTEEGVKKAVQDVVRFNQEFESSYSTPYQLGASNTNSLRASVADIVPKVTVRVDGKQVGSSDKRKLEEYLRKSNSNAVVNFQIYDRDFDSPVYTITGEDGKIYKIPMHNEYQQMLGPMQSVISKMIKGKTGVISYGADLIINGMDNGQRVNAVFSGGHTAGYQKQAKEMFDNNIVALEKAGFTREEAVSKLRSTTTQAAEFMRSGDAFPIVNEKTGKTAYIKNAVGYFPSASGRSQPTYYSFSQIGDSKVTSLGDMFYNNMSEFGSARNPYMNLPLLDLLKNKNMINLFSAGGSEDGFDEAELPDY